MGCTGSIVEPNESRKLFATEDASKDEKLKLDDLPWAFPRKFKFGSFTVNEKKIQVDKKYALQTLLGAIKTETGVNATYDFRTDRITFEGTDELKLGAKDDTSNFLKMAGLSSDGKNVVKSKFPVGKNPDEPVDDMDMEEVGVAYFDDAFSKASGPLGTTIELRKNLADGRQAVKDALEIPPEVKTMKDGIVALKKEAVNLTFEVVPNETGVEAKFSNAENCETKVGAIMTLVGAIQGALAAMPQLVQDLNDLVQEIKAKVEDFGAAKDALLGAGVSPLAIKGKMTLAKENLQKLSGAPGVLTDLKAEIEGIIADLKAAAEALKPSQ
jgi:flagellin-like hook-associated protein FlgL